MEAADVVLVSGKLENLPKAIAIARKTMTTVKFNILFTLAVKFIVLALAAFGMAFLWLAVFADVGVSIVAIVNSSLLLKYHAK